MRRSMPVRTLPGPTSRKRSAPWSAMRRTEDSQRTQESICWARALADGFDVDDEPGGDVGNELAAGGAELGVGEFAAHDVDGGADKGGVEGAGDGEADKAAAGFGGDEVAGGLDGGGIAGDDDLAGAVPVGGDDDAELAAGGDLVADFADAGAVEVEDGGHGAGLALAGVVHGLGAGADEAEAGLEIEDAGGVEGGVFADGVAGDDGGIDAFVAQDGEGGRRRR